MNRQAIHNHHICLHNTSFKAQPYAKYTPPVIKTGIIT